MSETNKNRKINYHGIRDTALVNIDAILNRFCAGGKRFGQEYTVSSPFRNDSDPSLKVNLRSGKWGDFAADKKGGDLISLVAYLENIQQWEAAKGLAEMLGVDPYEQ